MEPMEFESTILETINYQFSPLKYGYWFCKLLSDHPDYTDLILYKEQNKWKSGQGLLPYIDHLGACIDARLGKHA
jgi:hypothetical protein